MFIIFGDKVLEKDLGEYKVSGTCPLCHNMINLHVVKRSVWFTLYWIPVIPMQVKRYLVCPICGASAEISKEKAGELLGK